MGGPREFYFMLAMRLGKTVRQLLRETDAVELAEWKIWNHYHPIDDAREDARSAMICRTMANINRGRGQPPYRLDQFMPKYGERSKKDQTPLKQFIVMCAMKGIPVKRAKK